MEPPLSRRCPILLTLKKLTDWISVKGKTPPSRKLLGSVESVRQRNPPVITKSARGADDRLLKIAHFELGHCFRKQVSAARLMGTHRDLGPIRETGCGWSDRRSALVHSRPNWAVRAMSGLPLPAQPVDATQALNLSAGVSNCKVSRGRSLS